MKIETNTFLHSLPKAAPAKAAASKEEVPTDSFTSLPHADFDTNLSKLKANINRLDLSEARPNYSEPISNQDVDQTGFQEQLIANLGSFARMQYTHDCSKLQGIIPTHGQLQEQFDKMAADKNIPFEYIVDGCYARAHEMCDQMAQSEMNNAKMFVMVENPYGAGKLTAENKYMKAKWWYHVAPMVFAKDEATNKVEPFIMDPSMAPRPLKPEEWIGAMWDEKTRIKIDVVRNPQFGPLEATGPNETFEESVPTSKRVMADYTKKMDKIKEDYEKENPPAAEPLAA